MKHFILGLAFVGLASPAFAGNTMGSVVNNSGIVTQGGEPTAPAAPHQPVCAFPTDAAVSLSIKTGEAAILLGLIQNPDGVTVGQLRAISTTINAQVAALQAKYCK